MTTGNQRELKTWRLSAAAVFGLGLLIVFFDLEGYRTLTKHEGFVAVVSREMRESGDWVVPRFGGLPRLKKPPLAYWAAASAGWLFGEDSPWTARFPFAVSALLLAGLVGVWAGKWYGRWSGLAAALVQISCVYVISFSRKAEVDMLLCLLTTSALFLVANSDREEARSRTFFRWTAIYALVGLAWLAKFHYGPAMVLGVIGVWFVVDRRWPKLWDVLNPAGLLILAAAVVIWPWLLLQRVPEAWEIWRTETVGRALGVFGRDPFWFYIPQAFVQALPWSVLLWKAGRDSFQKAWKQGDTRERFLWVWFVTQFVILSISAFKHHHYLMAAMPALSLILGRTLASLWSDLRAGRVEITRRHVLTLASIALMTGVGAAVGISLKWPHLMTAAIVLGVSIGIAGVFCSIWLARQKWTSAAVTAGLGFAVCYGLITAAIFPNRDRRLPTVEFAQNLRQVVPEQQPLCVYGLKEDPIVYYLKQPAFRLESPEELSRRISQAGSLVILTDKAHVPELSKSHFAAQPLPLPQSSEPLPWVLIKLTPAATATSERSTRIR